MMITKIFEFYKMLNERAFNYDDTKNCIMIRSIKKHEIHIMLYNYIENKIVGYISADDKSSKEFWTIDRASAEKGWGPFMYTLLLQTLYPISLKPSSFIRPGAVKVWNEFLKNPRIETKELKTYEFGYSNMYHVDSDDSDFRPVTDEVKVINILFKYKPEPWFAIFVEDSERIIKEKNINVNKVLKQAIDFFYTKYYVKAEGINIPQKDISDKYLIINEKGSSIEILIQDTKNIFGYAELQKKSNYYQVINVAAETGWGPFLYDTIMLWLDKPVRPNRSLTREAWNVWNNYMINRPDVTKIEVKKDYWDSVDLDQKLNTYDSFIEPINYLYTIKDNERKTNTVDWWYNSESFVKEMISKLKDWKTIRFNFAKRWFNNKYPMHR